MPLPPPLPLLLSLSLLLLVASRETATSAAASPWSDSAVVGRNPCSVGEQQRSEGEESLHLSSAEANPEKGMTDDELGLIHACRPRGRKGFGIFAAHFIIRNAKGPKKTPVQWFSI